MPLYTVLLLSNGGCTLFYREIPPSRAICIHGQIIFLLVGCCFSSLGACSLRPPCLLVASGYAFRNLPTVTSLSHAGTWVYLRTIYILGLQKTWRIDFFYFKDLLQPSLLFFVSFAASRGGLRGFSTKCTEIFFHLTHSRAGLYQSRGNVLFRDVVVLTRSYRIAYWIFICMGNIPCLWAQTLVGKTASCVCVVREDLLGGSRHGSPVPLLPAPCKGKMDG